MWLQWISVTRLSTYRRVVFSSWSHFRLFKLANRTFLQVLINPSIGVSCWKKSVPEVTKPCGQEKIGLKMHLFHFIRKCCRMEEVFEPTSYLQKLDKIKLKCNNQTWHWWNRGGNLVTVTLLQPTTSPGITFTFRNHPTKPHKV